MSSMTKNDKLKRGASKVSQDGGGVVRRTAILNAFGNSEDRKAKRISAANFPRATAECEISEHFVSLTKLQSWFWSWTRHLSLWVHRDDDMSKYLDKYILPVPWRAPFKPEDSKNRRIMVGSTTRTTIRQMMRKMKDP